MRKKICTDKTLVYKIEFNYDIVVFHDNIHFYYVKDLKVVLVTKKKEKNENMQRLRRVDMTNVIMTLTTVIIVIGMIMIIQKIISIPSMIPSLKTPKSHLKQTWQPFKPSQKDLFPHGFWRRGNTVIARPKLSCQPGRVLSRGHISLSN